MAETKDKLVKAQAQIAEEEEEEKKEGEVEGEDEEEMEEKSENLTEDDLEKSLAKLQSLVEADDPVSRKQYLLEKAQQETLEKSEQAELFELLGADTADTESFGEEITKGMEENETLQKALDVSDFLQEQHTELVKSLSTLAEHMEKSDARQHEFNLILAKAVADEGKLIKSIAVRLSGIEDQPARQPKSKGVRALEKSFAGAAPATDQLGKSEALDGLMALMDESMSKGGNGVTEEGIDLAKAITKCELFGTVEPTLAAKLQARRHGATTH